jgi:hypothetical protein
MRTKLFVLVMLVSILLAACGGTQTQEPVATEAPVEEPAAPEEEPAAPEEEPAAPEEEPAAPEEEPAMEEATLKIYLLDYTPDTICCWRRPRYHQPGF